MQETLTTEIREEDGTLHLELSGHLNQETSGRLHQELSDHYSAGGHCDTVIGFEEIQFIGSSGFRVLLQNQRTLESAGFKLTMRRIPIRIMAVIKSLGFDKMFVIEE